MTRSLKSTSALLLRERLSSSSITLMSLLQSPSNPTKPQLNSPLRCKSTSLEEMFVAHLDLSLRSCCHTVRAAGDSLLKDPMTGHTWALTARKKKTYQTTKTTYRNERQNRRKSTSKQLCSACVANMINVRHTLSLIEHTHQVTLMLCRLMMFSAQIRYTLSDTSTTDHQTLSHWM